uniref:Uncharacterized protein n=1 Tax=Timema bartmani TaxID=61472 RepID=A0A7R9IAM4_9NEOP|nr:unnamed protein product [Timema bartmani]
MTFKMTSWIHKWLLLPQWL